MQCAPYTHSLHVRDGKGREGKGREGKGREGVGKGRSQPHAKIRPCQTGDTSTLVAVRFDLIPFDFCLHTQTNSDRGA